MLIIEYKTLYKILIKGANTNPFATVRTETTPTIEEIKDK